MGQADTIAEQAQLPLKSEMSRQNVYGLGPFTGRISFLYQQYRALNLVWALFNVTDSSKRLQAGQKVAVIGAGISGLTAALALHAKNIDVTVFEQARIHMVRQRYATHRFIHPRINWWPQDEDALNPTTSLPVLNWFAGRCEQVIDQLNNGGVSCYDKALGLPFPIHCDHELRDYSESHPTSGKIKLEFESNKADNTEFDVLILACGFDGDAAIDKNETTPEYWDHDNLEKLRDRSSKVRKFVVSGCGDGGLIDALRLAYRFSFGELAFKFALYSNGTWIEDRLTRALKSNSSPDFKGIAQDIWDAIDGHEEFVKSQKVSPSEPRYKSAEAACALVADNLIRMEGLVHLIDARAANFWEGQAAVVHKLLVAIAEKKKTIVFHQKTTVINKPKEDKTHYYLVAADWTTGNLVVDKDRIKIKLRQDETAVIIRHGAKSRLFQMQTMVHNPKVLTSKINDAEKTAELYYTPADWGEFYNISQIRGHLCRSGQLTKFMTHLKETASREVLELLEIDGDLSLNVDHFILQHRGQARYAPKHFFGISLQCRDLGESEPIDAL